MKCRECDCCYKGYFASKPDAYVCIGVGEPFVISDINRECTEYPEFWDKKFPTEDLFVVSFDNSDNGDCTALCVKRIHGDNDEIVKIFYNEDAFEMYNQLIGWR